MALGTFVPGHYAMTYNSVSVGLVKADDYALRYRYHAQVIDGTSQYGDTPIDGVYRGQTVKLTVTFLEWTTATKKAIWPWDAGAGITGALGVIGRLKTDLAVSIVLTPEANSPAAAAGGTFTASKGILAEENEIGILFGPRNRDMPVVFDLLPYDSSGIRCFSIT